MTCAGCTHLIGTDYFKPQMRCKVDGFENVKWVDWKEGCGKHEVAKVEKIEHIKPLDEEEPYLF